VQKPELPESGMLMKAKKTVDDNQAKYGNPTESWERVGRMWGAYLGIGDVPAWKCCFMMAQMKMIRETYQRNPDNNLDAAGYIDCAERVIVEELKVKNIIRSHAKRVWDYVTKP